VLPPSWYLRLESLTITLRRLANAGLGAASIIANFHRRRVIPLMKREFMNRATPSSNENPTNIKIVHLDEL
jgi:hypothetical protein